MYWFGNMSLLQKIIPLSTLHLLYDSLRLFAQMLGLLNI